MHASIKKLDSVITGCFLDFTLGLFKVGSYINISATFFSSFSLSSISGFTSLHSSPPLPHPSGGMATEFIPLSVIRRFSDSSPSSM